MTRKQTVTFLSRKPGPTNYSAEFIFEDVRRRLDASITPVAWVCPFQSRGVFRRVANILAAAWAQSEVNHVTGDVNYLGALLDPSRTIQTILDCGNVARARGLRKEILRFWWIWLPARRCARITVISESVKHELLRHVTIDPEKVTVVPVAIASEFRRCDRSFNRACPTILQVGTDDNKNIPNLIRAVRGLPCSLHILGRKRPEHERLLEAAGVAYRYWSGLDRGDVVRLYEEADILAFPSTYEGFGMPILEAQAVGRPVVTSNVYSMPEVAGDGACLVDPSDPGSIRRGLDRVINDAEYRKRLVERGFENVLRFDPEGIARKYLDLYLSIGTAR